MKRFGLLMVCLLLTFTSYATGQDDSDNSVEGRNWIQLAIRKNRDIAAGAMACPLRCKRKCNPVSSRYLITV